MGALGFEIDYERPEAGFVSLRFLDSQIMLEEIVETNAASDSEFEMGGWRTGKLDFPFGRGVSFEITVPDVESVHARVLEHGYAAKLGLRQRTYRVADETVEVRQF